MSSEMNRDMPLVGEKKGKFFKCDLHRTSRYLVATNLINAMLCGSTDRECCSRVWLRKVGKSFSIAEEPNYFWNQQID